MSLQTVIIYLSFQLLINREAVKQYPFVRFPTFKDLQPRTHYLSIRASRPERDVRGKWPPYEYGQFLVRIM